MGENRATSHQDSCVENCTRTNQFRILSDSLQLVWFDFGLLALKICSFEHELTGVLCQWIMNADADVTNWLKFCRIIGCGGLVSQPDKFQILWIPSLHIAGVETCTCCAYCFLNSSVWSIWFSNFLNLTAWHWQMFACNPLQTCLIHLGTHRVMK